MGEETKKSEESEVSTFTQDEFDKMIQEKMDAMEKKYQGEIDRRVNAFVKENKELKSELEGLRKEKMTEEEQRTFDRQKHEQELLEIQKEKERVKLSLAKEKIINEVGVPEPLRDFVNGASSEAMHKSANDLVSYINTLTSEQAQQKLKDAISDNSTPPKGGDSVKDAVVYRPGMTREEISKHIDDPVFMESVRKHKN